MKNDIQNNQAQEKKDYRRFRMPRIVIDLGNARHRRVLLVTMMGFFIVLTGLLISGYEVYEYTESSEFCGTVCHPMFSQFVRYEASAHANVACADCHVGPGAQFFVKSKLDGVRQVYALLSHTYQRPIKSPVENLRPARETCETCHTPTSYRDNIVKSVPHYENDSENTPILSTFILKMGGWKESVGVSQGIHWHITNPVYYIATDDLRQDIAWVGVENTDGSLRQFYSSSSLAMGNISFVEEARQRGEVRLLDCIDCHNRAAHFIPPPEQMVDEAIADGLISSNLPYIRMKAVEVLKNSYSNQNEMAAAVTSLANYYQTNFPQIYTSKSSEINQALTQLMSIYKDTNFPEMDLNWESNPNNERHTPTAGCFRCHDDKHFLLDERGNSIESISGECNLCHTVPIIGRGDDLLVEAPVIVGSVPSSHEDFRWTIAHRNVSEAEKQDCFNCHGQGFCNNGVCHNLSHPEDMLFQHAEIFRALDNGQTCYACHQNITCAKCHAEGIVMNP